MKLTCYNCYFYWENGSECQVKNEMVDPDEEDCPDHSGYPWFRKYTDGRFDKTECEGDERRNEHGAPPNREAS